MTTTPEGKIKEEIRDENNNLIQDKLVDTDIEYTNNKPEELNVSQECDNCKKLDDPGKQIDCLNGVCDKLPADHPKKEECKKEIQKQKDDIKNENKNEETVENNIIPDQNKVDQANPSNQITPQQQNPSNQITPQQQNQSNPNSPQQNQSNPNSPQQNQSNPNSPQQQNQSEQLSPIESQNQVNSPNKVQSNDNQVDTPIDVNNPRKNKIVPKKDNTPPFVEEPQNDSNPGKTKKNNLNNFTRPETNPDIIPDDVIVRDIG